ncbi:unnamed protein product [Mytilus coruscus]|uniref:Integrase catalytic domain-containing protein n=1 Tax=Mytilus coruscus TaxID=42192 RepID=A0A6J8CCA7_MYTCO|nr:unnamed protein product [Mytilus coruscus]
MDIMGPLPRSIQGNNYLLVIGDYFTKFVHAIPLKSQEAEVVAQTLVNSFISIFGVPSQIHTDQGADFESQLFQELCKLIDIDKTRTTVMRPQSNGMAERFIRTLENMLSSFVSNHQKDWDKFVPILMMAYRSAEHESTGVSPCRMMYGREINLPVDLLFGKSPDGPKSSFSDFVNDLEHTLLTVHEFARTNLNFASDVMKKNYDHNIHLKLFNPGDPVWYYKYQRKNSTGRRGKDAEEDLEKFKRDEMPKKIKLVDNNGNEVEVASRRNRYARSEIGDTSNRITCNSKGGEFKKRGSSLNETSRKRTDIENKENNNISGPTPAKLSKPSETKEQKLKKIKDVLQDLMSENGETITICLEPEADKTEGESQILEEVELHVSEKEVSTLEKADKSQKSSSSSTTSSGSSSSSSSSSGTVKKSTPGSMSQKAENVVVEPLDTEIEPIRNVEFSAKTELVETFLQSLQDTQENTRTLNVGGMKVETSKNTLRADPSCVFALMLQPLSPLRPSNNVYCFDRDPANFKIILNYLRNNCTVEKDISLGSMSTCTSCSRRQNSINCLNWLQQYRRD